MQRARWACERHVLVREWRGMHVAEKAGCAALRSRECSGECRRAPYVARIPFCWPAWLAWAWRVDRSEIQNFCDNSRESAAAHGVPSLPTLFTTDAKRARRQRPHTLPSPRDSPPLRFRAPASCPVAGHQASEPRTTHGTRRARSCCLAAATRRRARARLSCPSTLGLSASPPPDSPAAHVGLRRVRWGCCLFGRSIGRHVCRSLDLPFGRFVCRNRCFPSCRSFRAPAGQSRGRPSLSPFSRRPWGGSWRLSCRSFDRAFRHLVCRPFSQGFPRFVCRNSCQTFSRSFCRLSSRTSCHCLCRSTRQHSCRGTHAHAHAHFHQALARASHSVCPAARCNGGTFGGVPS